MLVCLLQSKRKEHEQLLTQLKQDYTTQMSILMSGGRHSPAQSAPVRTVHSPQSLGSDTSRCNSLSPESLNQSPLHSVTHQILHPSSPSSDSSLTSESSASFASVGSSVLSIDTEMGQMLKQSHPPHRTGSSLHNFTATQQNVSCGVNKPGVLPSSSISSLMMTTSSPGIHCQVDVTGRTGVQGTVQNSTHLLGAKPRVQEIPDGSSHTSQSLTYHQGDLIGMIQQGKAITNHFFVDSNRSHTISANPVPCSNPDECPNGGRCDLSWET